MLTLIMYSLRWCALFIVGGQIFFIVHGEESLSDSVVVFGTALIQWLIAAGLNLCLGRPKPPKLFDSIAAKIIVVILCILSGYGFAMVYS